MGQRTLTGKDPLADWYARHSLEYSLTEKRLADTKARFMSSSYDVALDMFEKSYVYAVVSQQSPVEIYEPAFVNWVNGMDMETAFQPVNYRNQKRRYIEDTLADEHKKARCVRLLREGRLDYFCRFAVEHVKGLGWAKAPFVAAMLGFTSMACADTNVCQYLDIESPETVEDYRDFKELLSQDTDINADSFLLQWLVFDFQRGYHETHKNWFQAVDTWTDRRDLSTDFRKP